MSRIRTADIIGLLRRRVQWGIHLGLLKGGDRLSSLRAAAAEFGVDQRSILAAYRQLEKEGLVELRPRSGIYVAGESSSAPTLDSSARWMAEMFLHGFARGVPPIALGATLTKAIGTKALNAACLECNTDQILWIASQLRTEFGLSTTWVESGAPHDAATAERLRASNFIVTTVFHADEARRLGEEYGLPVIVATANRDEITQIRAELSRGPAYFLGADERYARKLLDASGSARWMANLRALVLEGISPPEIPGDGPLYITKAVAEVLGAAVPRGAKVIDYPFSSETRGEIIATMLAAYLEANESARD